MESSQPQQKLPIKPQVKGVFQKNLQIVRSDKYLVITDNANDQEQIQRAVNRHVQVRQQSNTSDKVDQQIDNANERLKMWSLTQKGYLGIKPQRPSSIKSKNVLKNQLQRLNEKDESLQNPPGQGNNSTGCKASHLLNIVVVPQVQKQVAISEHSSESPNSSKKSQDFELPLLSQEGRQDASSLEHKNSNELEVSFRIYNQNSKKDIKFSSDPIKSSKDSQQKNIFRDLEVLQSKKYKSLQGNPKKNSYSESLSNSLQSEQVQQSVLGEIQSARNVAQSSFDQPQEEFKLQSLISEEPIANQNEQIRQESSVESSHQSQNDHSNQIINSQDEEEQLQEIFQHVNTIEDFPDENSTEENSIVSVLMYIRQSKLHKKDFKASRGAIVRLAQK